MLSKIKKLSLSLCLPDLLHCMRMIGMEGTNIFSNISKMADSQVVMATEEGHPIHGLKKSLIRLIGNMSYCNKAIQDQVWAKSFSVFLLLLSVSTLRSVPAWIMTCQCLRSSAITVVIWFLAISSFTRSRLWSASISLSIYCHL